VATAADAFRSGFPDARFAATALRDLSRGFLALTFGADFLTAFAGLGAVLRFAGARFGLPDFAVVLVGLFAAFFAGLPLALADTGFARPLERVLRLPFATDFARARFSSLNTSKGMPGPSESSIPLAKGRDKHRFNPFIFFYPASLLCQAAIQSR
jgi:hypothetical protein